jgi:hypothetical protein
MQGYLMYIEPDDVMDTSDDMWKSGYFQIRSVVCPIW